MRLQLPTSLLALALMLAVGASAHDPQPFSVDTQHPAHSSRPDPKAPKHAGFGGERQDRSHSARALKKEGLHGKPTKALHHPANSAEDVRHGPAVAHQERDASSSEDEQRLHQAPAQEPPRGQQSKGSGKARLPDRPQDHPAEARDAPSRPKDAPRLEPDAEHGDKSHDRPSRGPVKSPPERPGLVQRAEHAIPHPEHDQQGQGEAARQSGPPNDKPDHRTSSHQASNVHDHKPVSIQARARSEEDVQAAQAHASLAEPPKKAKGRYESSTPDKAHKKFQGAHEDVHARSNDAKAAAADDDESGSQTLTHPNVWQHSSLGDYSLPWHKGTHAKGAKKDHQHDGDRQREKRDEEKSDEHISEHALPSHPDSPARPPRPLERPKKSSSGAPPAQSGSSRKAARSAAHELGAQTDPAHTEAQQKAEHKSLREHKGVSGQIKTASKVLRDVKPQEEEGEVVVGRQMDHEEPKNAKKPAKSSSTPEQDHTQHGQGERPAKVKRMPFGKPDAALA